MIARDSSAMPATLRTLIRPALTGFVFSAIATGWCGATAGWGLPVFFGAILLSAMYVPAITLAEPRSARWASPLGVVVGISACWSISTINADVTLIELLRCATICITFVFALAGMASLL